jgi:hypothetical protein
MSDGVIRGRIRHDPVLYLLQSRAAERHGLASAEVDGANAARDFLRSHGIAQQEIDWVWTAIALHTTPGIPQHMHPLIALVTAGVEMDVLADKDPHYHRGNFCSVIRGSAWPA